MKTLMLIAILLMSFDAQAGWRTQTSTDDMTGEKSSVAVSSFVSSVSPMSFPYKGTSVRVIVGCYLRDWDDNKPGFYAYLHFTQAPNISNSETKSGYSVIPVYSRWDSGDIVRREYKQDWGAPFLHPYDFMGSDFVADIKARNTLAIRLTWHGQNSPVFKISMAGSSKAIASIIATCK